MKKRVNKKQKTTDTITNPSKNEMELQNTGPNINDVLPREVLQLIFCNVDFRKIQPLKNTCQKWGKLIEEVEANDDHIGVFREYLWEDNLAEAHQYLKENKIVDNLYFHSNPKEERSKESTLHLLARIIPEDTKEEGQFIEIFDALLKGGADINAIYEYVEEIRDHDGVLIKKPARRLTVLMEAILYDNKFYFDLLLKYNADINIHFDYYKDGYYLLYGSALTVASLYEKDEDSYFFKTLLQQPHLTFNKKITHQCMEYHQTMHDEQFYLLLYKLIDRNNEFLTGNTVLSKRVQQLENQLTELKAQQNSSTLGI